MTGTTAAGKRTAIPAVRPSVRVAVWVLHIAIPLLGLWLLVARPNFDVRWEQYDAHFALTLLAAAISFGVGGRMNFEAAARQDARLFLVSLAFTASAGFFALHALSTPNIFLGRNTGFILATPVGLLVAGFLAAASALEVSPVAGAALMKRRATIRAGLAVLLLAWLAATLLKLPPLNGATTPSEARGPLVALMWGGSALYLAAASRYWQLYRRQPAVMLVSVITAFGLLAEATIAATYGRAWKLSWWEWHILLITAFGFVAYAAVVQWRREGSTASLFGAIALRETLRDIQRSYAAALEAVVAAIEAGRPLTAEMAALEDRFGLSERQIDVLLRAAEALAHERDMIRRQAALVAIGEEASVIRTEEDLLDRVRAIADNAFAPDRVRVRLPHDAEPEPAADVDRSYPLLVKGKEAGVVTVDRPDGAIEERDESLYESFASEVSIALENTRLYRQIDVLFRSYLSPDVATSLLADPTQAELGGATQEVTILMADLRGFTPFAERSQPADVVAMLNVYFGCFVPIILDEGGTVVQFVGDALMAMFNAPVRQPDHARRAARAALRGQAATHEAGAAYPDWPHFRMGINSGPSLVGNIGSRDVRCFTAIGDTTNLAARLESVAPVGGVVISAATLERLGPGAQVEELGDLTLKGKALPVAAYRLVALI